MKHSPYLSAVLMNEQTHSDCVQGILRAIAHAEKFEGMEWDAVACTGISGLLIGPTIAYLSGKRLAVVRKSNDKPGQNVNHACVQVEHNLHDGDRVLIIDDLIASGRTVMAVQDAIRALADEDMCYDGYPRQPVRAKCIGYYMYRDHRLQRGTF